MVKLRWLQVNKFRSVKPGTQLTFNDGHNVLLGQNGTGKTTLLNLVAAALQSSFTDFEGEEFDISYALASEKLMATLWLRNENRAPPTTLESKSMPYEFLRIGALTSEMGLRSPMLSVTATVSSKQTGLQVEFEFNSSQGTARRTDEPLSGPPVELNRLNTNKFPPWALIILGLGEFGIQHPAFAGTARDFIDLLAEHTFKRFDESLEYFDNLGELHLRVIRSPDEHIELFGDLDPLGTMSERLRGLIRNKWGADRYVLSDTDLQFLKHTIQLLDFESAEAIIDLKESKKEDVNDVMHLGNLRFYFTHRGGWKISEKMLSYGQKRMLAFMHYLTTAKSTVISDELVNGLHHRWIRACFEALGQRQVFLTSQNPLLLDYLNFQSPEDVLSTFVLCRWEKGPEQMVWENMTQEAAEDFFASYKVGFQQVGELLQSKGLW
jgi:energy-coupling factor transporter ATP-binding protein EcfA2